MKWTGSIAKSASTTCHDSYINRLSDSSCNYIMSDAKARSQNGNGYSISPRSIKKIKRAILIFLGKNFNFIKSFDITSFVILRLLACGAVLLFPHNLARQHNEEE
jgi:hypothetical protein